MRWTREQYEAYQARRSLSNAKPAQCPAPLGGDGPGETPRPSRPVVRFTLFRQRFLDVDSKYGSVADLLDGLQYAGLIPGDREGQITLEVHQQKVKLKSNERTEIEITG